MSAVRRLRNFWILWVTTIVLACLSNELLKRATKLPTCTLTTAKTTLAWPWASIITAGRRTWMGRSTLP